MNTGETQASWSLQVGGDAALVPQQTAVAQFDGGNELSSTRLRLVTGCKDNTTFQVGFQRFHHYIALGTFLKYIVGLCGNGLNHAQTN